ncbi:hypothetical protein CDAR_580471 [Caerostris darwini]|uniref:Uncharacterized protein n=1 Tax=Caerostris darwini TaxID=1538125 RepID=A0AAV4REB8_9ARAC|nr:hypothetical protein CDAR_580471 [Caerostris darwini]
MELCSDSDDGDFRDLLCGMNDLVKIVGGEHTPTRRTPPPRPHTNSRVVQTIPSATLEMMDDPVCNSRLYQLSVLQ